MTSDDPKAPTSLDESQWRKVQARHAEEQRQARRNRRPLCTKCDDTGALSITPVHDDNDPWATHTVWCNCPTGQERAQQ